MLPYRVALASVPVASALAGSFAKTWSGCLQHIPFRKGAVHDFSPPAHDLPRVHAAFPVDLSEISRRLNHGSQGRTDFLPPASFEAAVRIHPYL